MNTGIALDITLAATAGASMLYCAVLSRRVAALRSTRTGVIPAVKALTEAVQRSRSEAEGIRRAADEATAQLNETFDALEARRQASEDLIGILDGQAAAAERNLASAAQSRSQEIVQGTERALEVLTQRARIEFEALSNAVEIAGRISQSRPPSVPPRRGVDAEPLPTSGTARQRPASGANPFLRAVGS